MDWEVVYPIHERETNLSMNIKSNRWIHTSHLIGIVTAVVLPITHVFFRNATLIIASNMIWFGTITYRKYKQNTLWIIIIRKMILTNIFLYSFPFLSFPFGFDFPFILPFFLSFPTSFLSDVQSTQNIKHAGAYLKNNLLTQHSFSIMYLLLDLRVIRKRSYHINTFLKKWNKRTF